MKQPSEPRIAGSRVSDYDYVLPPGRVARYPAAQRDGSRLLVVDRRDSSLQHLHFTDLTALISAGDVLVVNESRVLPVRLLGKKPTGAPAEILLLRPASLPKDASGAGQGGDAAGAGQGGDKVWEALVRPGGKLKPGRRVEISSGLTVEILDATPDGGRLVRLLTELSGEEALRRFGHMPLPPYIDREDEELDRERYQTVYAREPGSVAAPTAGLHFTDALLNEVALRGVEVAKVTLHVGVGTFRPVDVEDPADHTMHSELYQIPSGTAEAVNRCRTVGGKVWAVGTTVVRTLESCVGEDGRVRPGGGRTRLFIRPPYRFQVVDRLVTNFHLPRSTLLMLVSAFAGYHRVREAYDAAIQEGYRFYSYGDAMVIL
ncbi:MAG: tRNA preQ1(34) S-adenosylmethionine ribosyltransferase-isomerase QueA [Gemmatimonadota bacterium]